MDETLTVPSRWDDLLRERHQVKKCEAPKGKRFTPKYKKGVIATLTVPSTQRPLAEPALANQWTKCEAPRVSRPRVYDLDMDGNPKVPSIIYYLLAEGRWSAGQVQKKNLLAEQR